MLICRNAGSKVVFPSRRHAQFRILFVFCDLGRTHATKLSTLSALPVPMLGLVYLKWCFRGGETFIFDVRGLKMVLPSRRNAHFRMLGYLRAILSHLGGILGHLGAILGASWVILGSSWVILGPSWAILGPS